MKLSYIYIYYIYAHTYMLRCCCFMFNHQPGRYKYKPWQWHPPYGHPMRAQLAACSSTAVRCDMLRFFLLRIQTDNVTSPMSRQFLYHVFLPENRPRLLHIWLVAEPFVVWWKSMRWKTCTDVLPDFLKQIWCGRGGKGLIHHLWMRHGICRQFQTYVPLHILMYSYICYRLL